jgi:uncharacterized protein (DUF1015 family)
VLHRWLHPVVGAVVRPDVAGQVVTPAYDALGEEDREDERRTSPLTYLHALPTTTRAGGVTDADLTRCREAVERLERTAFADWPRDFVAVYRLVEDGHVQTGLVADLDTAALGNVVRGHEHTLREREDDLLRYLDRVGVQSSPVCLAARDPAGLAGALGVVTSRAPDVTVTRAGLLQQLWVVDAPDDVADLLGATAAIEQAVITDGHHRAAAAARHRAGRVLVALFPASELHVSGFHRVVRPSLPDLADLPDRLRDHGLGVVPASGSASPSPGVALLRSVRSAWFATLDTDAPGPDVRRLQDQVLGPVFGIDDPRHDVRLHHLPTATPMSRLLEVAGPDGVAVTTVAPDVEDLLAAARDERTLPPKSTYVRPKARSGLLLVPRAPGQRPAREPGQAGPSGPSRASGP